MKPSSIEDPVARYSPRSGAAITARIATIDTIDARDGDHHDDECGRREPPDTNGVGVGVVVTP
jgi:hypothetical protein